MNQNLHSEYIQRINKVIDYIEKNLNRNITLKQLAEIANFSPFHFHRIFRGMVKEPLNQFIQRLRIEKAASVLLINPKKSITEIAFDCGFSGSATFARVFKEYYQMSASQWRNKYKHLDSKNSKTISNNSQIDSNASKDFEIYSSYNPSSVNQFIWRIKMKKSGNLSAEVKIEEMSEFYVAYVRHIGPYKGDGQLFENLFNKLFTWAGPRGILNFPDTRILAVYHDNPEITEEDKLRTSICVSIDKNTDVNGEVGKMKINGGKYALARFEIDQTQYEEAWNAVFGGWLPQSGYQPDDGPCFELYHNNPKEHPEHKHIIDICIPVKPL